jgi:pyridoxal phosphate enzyme (YggS family)
LPSRTAILRLNLERVRKRLAAAAHGCGRSPGDVQLVAVTKSVDPQTALELARELASTAHRAIELGENRAELLEAKVASFRASGDAVAAAVRWNMIGHLQRNKARRVASLAHAVHSVDSERLAQTLERLAAEFGRELDLYLEVELTGLPTRSGLRPAELLALCESGLELRHARLRGLMTMAAPAPLARAGELATQESARRTFAQLRELGERLPRGRFVDGRVELSMGMSDDLEAAVAEGATRVRIGSALFEGVASADAPEASA